MCKDNIAAYVRGTLPHRGKIVYLTLLMVVYIWLIMFADEPGENAYFLLDNISI